MRCDQHWQIDTTNRHAGEYYPVSDDEVLATERIEVLADRARQAAREGREERAREYVRRARRIAQRHRRSLPPRFERFTCEDCDRYLIPGRSARVRTRDGHLVITCDCGAQARYLYE